MVRPRQPQDGQRGEAAAALVDQAVAGEDVDVLNRDARPRRQQRPPVPARAPPPVGASQAHTAAALTRRSPVFGGWSA